MSTRLESSLSKRRVSKEEGEEETAVGSEESVPAKRRKEDDQDYEEEDADSSDMEMTVDASQAPDFRVSVSQSFV